MSKNKQLVRRDFLKLTGLTTGALVLQACGRTPATPAASEVDESEPEAEQVTIEWWDPETREPFIEASSALIADFKAAYPNYDVNMTTVGWGEISQKVMASFSSDTMPDLAYSYATIHINWAYAGMLSALDAVLDAIGREEFSEALLGNVTVNGELVSLPLYTYPHILVYRKDLYEEAGLEPPSSWEDLVNNAAALHNPPDTYGWLLFNTPEDPNVYWDLAGCNDAPPLDPDGNPVFNSDNVVEVLEQYKQMAEFAPPGWLTKSDLDMRLLFSEGNGAHMFTSTSIGPFLLESPLGIDVFGAVPVPVNRGNRQATNDFGTYNIPSGAQHPEAAADLLKFWFTPENNIEFFKTHVPGHIPTMKSARESAEYLESPNIAAIAPFVQAASEAAEKGTMSGAFYGPHELLGKILAAEIYTQMVDKVVELDEDPHDVAQWAQQEAEALIG